MHGSSRESEPDMREIEAVRARREVLSNMAILRQDRAGRNLTTATVVEEINETAIAMERLFDATHVAKTLIGLKGWRSLCLTSCRSHVLGVGPIQSVVRPDVLGVEIFMG